MNTTEILKNAATNRCGFLHDDEVAALAVADRLHRSLAITLGGGERKLANVPALASTSAPRGCILMAVVEILPVAADYQTHPQSLSYHNQTLPTLLGSPQLHTLGPVAVMGTIYPGLESSGFQIQGNLATQRTDGDLYPRVAHRTEVAPQLTLSHRDPLAIMNLVGLTGLTISAPGIIAYFKAYDNADGQGSGTGLVSAANGMSITVALGRLTHSGAEANQGQVLANQLLVTGINPDGISSPLVIATGVAIPEVP